MTSASNPTSLEQIIEVLLPDGKWHRMESESFRVYKSFLQDKEIPIPGTEALHFCFIPAGSKPDPEHGIPPMIHGPLSSVLGYRTDLEFEKDCKAGTQTDRSL